MASHQLAGMFLGEMQALRGGAKPQPPPPSPSGPTGRRHSRLLSILHALGAKAWLGQERGQELSRVGVPRGVVAARRCRSELAAVGDTGGQRDGDTPEEGELLPVHPGLEAQRWVLPEGRHDEAEEQGDADEDGGQDYLPGAGGQGRLRTLLPHPLPTLRTTSPSHPRPPCRTCAKKPRVLRRAWSILLMKRARSCWRVSAQPLTLWLACPAAPRSRSVSPGSSAGGAEMCLGLAPAQPAVRGRGSCQATCGGNGVLAGLCPPPWWGWGAACRDAKGAPQTPPTPSSYLDGVLGLSVKEMKEGLQPHRCLPSQG